MRGTGYGQILCFEIDLSLSACGTLLTQATTQALNGDQNSDNAFQCFESEVCKSYESSHTHIINKDYDGDSYVEIL